MEFQGKQLVEGWFSKFIRRVKLRDGEDRDRANYDEMLKIAYYTGIGDLLVALHGLPEDGDPGPLLYQAAKEVRDYTPDPKSGITVVKRKDAAQEHVA